MKYHASPGTPSRSFKALATAVVLGLTTTTGALLGSGAVAAQDAQFGTAELVPESALMYVRGSLDLESDQWQLVDELIDRSGIEEVSGESFSVTDFQEEGGVPIDGEVAFVLTDINAEAAADFEEAVGSATDPMMMATDVPSGFAVLYQPEDFAAVEAELRAQLEESATEVETSEYNGVTIEYLPPADEFSDGYAFAVINDETLAVATVAEDLEPIIDTANGDTEPISGNDDFTAMQGELTTDSLVFGFVNGGAIFDQLAEIDPTAVEQIPAEVQAQADATVGTTFYAAEEGFRFDSLVVPSPDAELPQLTPFEPTLDERVGDDSLVFATGSDIGPSGALDALALVFASALVGQDPLATPEPAMDPEAYADEIFAQSEQVIGFNIKTDLVDQLIGEYAFSVNVEEFDLQSQQIDAVFVSGADDPTTVNDVLSKISFLAATGAPEDTVTSRDLEDGTSIYQVNVGDETFPMVIEFGVIGDQLVIGLNNGIDEYVNGPDQPLADDENYQAVFESLPSEVTSASFVNIPHILPMIDELEASLSASVPDNDPACAEYETQEDAQAAYEEDFNFDLDLDFDGEACEDFFAPATPAASPAATFGALNIQGLGMVTYDADGNIGQSALLAIGD